MKLQVKASRINFLFPIFQWLLVMVCVIKVPLVHRTVHKWWYRWRKKMATAGFGRPRQGLVCPFDDVRIIHFTSSNRRQLNCSLCCFLHFTLYFSLSIKSNVRLPLHLIPHQQHTRGGRGAHKCTYGLLKAQQRQLSTMESLIGSQRRFLRGRKSL